MVASAAIGAGGTIAGGYLSGRGGGSSGGTNNTGFNLPEYQLDPYYGSSQETLSGFGTNLLQGKPGSYFGPIGEIGGKLFEDVLAKGKRDISRTVTEDFARRNVRGARGANVIGKQVADYSKDARFTDMLRALEGRKFLLGTGADILGGVRSGSLAQTGLRSQFDLGRSKLQLGYAELAMKEKEAKGSMWSNILSSVIGAGAKLGSAYLTSGGGGSSGDGGYGDFQADYGSGGGYSFSDINM